jgi:hypothetical protein
MIPVERVPEPEDFDARVRRPGRAWLASNPPPQRPRDLWSPFRPVLASGFGHRCGYTAMYDPVGSVDHHLSVKVRRDLTYEWDNYRFCQEWLNKSKRNEDQAVLDPYEVEEGWFEIALPSLTLRATEKIPRDLRARAERTLDRLHLRDDERVLRQRREWYRMYQEGELSLAGLRRKAPLIAAAVDKQKTTRKKKRGT